VLQTAVTVSPDHSTEVIGPAGSFPLKERYVGQTILSIASWGPKWGTAYTVLTRHILINTFRFNEFLCKGVLQTIPESADYGRPGP
jgi:hypothetical protein